MLRKLIQIKVLTTSVLSLSKKRGLKSLQIQQLQKIVSPAVCQLLVQPASVHVLFYVITGRRYFL